MNDETAAATPAVPEENEAEAAPDAAEEAAESPAEEEAEHASTSADDGAGTLEPDDEAH